MCGRYVLKAKEEDLKQEFDAIVEKIQAEIFKPRYNIAPRQYVPVIRLLEAERITDALRWGLIPRWANDVSIGDKLINARAETVAEKPSFRNALKERRCIIPASGFYEWKKEREGKQPFYFLPANKPLFGFAGLWEEWTDKETGDAIESCTIITTEANAVLNPVHHRMPVILKSEDYETWLDAQIKDAEKLTSLLKPYSANEMRSYSVSKKVNTPTNDFSELIKQLDSQ